MDAPPPSPLHPPPEPFSQNDSAAANPAAETYPTPPISNPAQSSTPTATTCISKKFKKKKKISVLNSINSDSPSSSSSTSSSYLRSSERIKRRFRVPVRTPKLLLGLSRRKDFAGHGDGEADISALALPLGMAIAAVVAQVLERKDAAREKISVDHLSVICTSAVKESLEYVFGYRFDGFVRNFEKSFQSTLRTLRLVNDSSQASATRHGNSHTRASLCPQVTPHSTPDKEEDSTCTSSGRTCQLESLGQTTSGYMQPTILEDTENSLMTQQLTLHHGQREQQLACVSTSSNSFDPARNQSMISTFRKSVMEQSRSNNLKEFELGLVEKKLELEAKQLDLMSEANSLERWKISMGYCKASFKAEKFKTELGDTRRAELLRQCIDCLVFGLVIMLCCLGYGVYIYSFERITEATATCMPSMVSKSRWSSWIPQPMASFNSGWQMLTCHVQVFSRILFAVLIIFAIIYLLIQRSASSNQTMPLTFIILILGIAVGTVGKFCIDTLGGSGYHWLLHWEVLCFLHFFSTVWTSVLYSILYGPINPSQPGKSNAWSAYLMRRIAYYMVMLLVLPVFCGLIPFASLGEWKDHFSSMITSDMVD